MASGRGILLVSLCGLAALGIWLVVPDPPRGIDDPYRVGLEAISNGDSATWHECMRLLEGDEFLDQRRVLQAARAVKAQHPDEALTQLAAVPQDGPLRRDVLLYSGIALQQQSRLSEAEMQLTSLIVEFPEDSDAYRWLGAVYFDLGAYDLAVGQLNRAAELAPDDYEVHYLLSVIHGDFENDSVAVQHIQAALERDPPADVVRELHAALGVSLMRLRDYEGALDALKDVEPTVTTEVARARCHWNFNRRDEAMASLDWALTEEPLDRDGLMLKAEILEAEGDVAGAVALLEQVVDADPYDADACYQLALTLGRDGQEAEAAGAMARWQELNDLNTRLVELNVQANTDVRNAEVRDEIASVCDQLGKHELAETWRRAAAACRQRETLLEDAQGAGETPAGESDPVADERAAAEMH